MSQPLEQPLDVIICIWALPRSRYRRLTTSLSDHDAVDDAVDDVDDDDDDVDDDGDVVVGARRR